MRYRLRFAAAEQLGYGQRCSFGRVAPFAGEHVVKQTLAPFRKSAGRGRVLAELCHCLHDVAGQVTAGDTHAHGRP